jgi:hypothetical protein
VLLALLFLFGEPDRPAAVAPDPGRWTAVDSLRAMAHIGEPGRWKDRDDRFVRTAIISSARAEPRDATIRAEPERPARRSLLNARASMDFPNAAKSRAPRPKKARVAARTRRVHTAVAEKPPDEFRPPSW